MAIKHYVVIVGHGSRGNSCPMTQSLSLAARDVEEAMDTARSVVRSGNPASEYAFIQSIQPTNVTHAVKSETVEEVA